MLCPTCGRAFHARIGLISRLRTHLSRLRTHLSRLRTHFSRLRTHQTLSRDVVNCLPMYAMPYMWEDLPCPDCMALSTVSGHIKPSHQASRDVLNCQSPHVCPTCGRAFRARIGLISRLRTHLSRLRTHQTLSRDVLNCLPNCMLCPTCGRTLRARTGLINRLRTHRTQSSSVWG